MKDITAYVLRWFKKIPIIPTLVGMAIGSQLLVILGLGISSEWIVRRGTIVRLQVDAIDAYDPFRGHYFEFVPMVFRHSFPSSMAISAGDTVIVGPTDKDVSQWAILTAPPAGDTPYYRVRVESSNNGYFFLSPPFKQIYLDSDEMERLRKRLGKARRGQKVPMTLIVRHRGDHAIILGLQVDEQVIGKR